MAKFGFDVSEVDASAQVSRDPVPAGDYVLRALEAEEKSTKDGSGSYINVKFEVVGGDFNGRYIWNIFNVSNKSEKAQQIGRQQLVAWATACGKPDADDTDKLIDKKFTATVSVEKGTGGYADSNRIKAFLFGGAEDKPKAAAASKPAAPRPAPATSSGNPWD